MKKSMLFRSVFVLFFAAMAFGAAAQSKVNITDFNVVKEQNKIDINWSTEKGEPTNYFEVEKSNDGKNFKTVAYVFGADPEKNDCKCFGCFDKVNSKNTAAYYRLKHVDADGYVQFSEVKMIALK